MSHSTAYAFVRGVPDDELRPTLVAIVETLHYVQAELELPITHLAPFAWSPLETAMLDALGALRQDAEDARKEADAAQQDAAEAQNRLEEKLQADPTVAERDDAIVRDLRAAIGTLTQERDDLRTRIAATKALVEAHADLVAMARRFTSAAVTAGVPLKHARRVPRASTG